MHHVGSDHNATSTESNFDGNGSYLFKYHTNFAAAKTAFESAFNDIVCNGGILKSARKPQLQRMLRTTSILFTLAHQVEVK